MNISIFRYEQKKLFSGEMWCILIFASVVLAAGAFFEVILPRFHWPRWIEDSRGPAFNSMLHGSGIGTMTLLLQPALIGLCSVFTYCDEKCSYIMYRRPPRSTRVRYYLSKLCFVWIVSFLLSFIPYLINYGLCVMAFPEGRHLSAFKTNAYMINQTAFDYEAERVFFPVLYFSYPFLNVLIYTGLIGLWNAGLCGISYALSLFYHRNRLIVLILPTLAYIACMLLFSMMGLRSLMLADALRILPVYPSTLTEYGVQTGLLWIGALAAVLLKTKGSAFCDEL